MPPATFAPGLSMLWEDADPLEALRARFGLSDPDRATRWLAAALHGSWGLCLDSCDRLLLSSTNALAWANTDGGSYVIKVASHQPSFERLERVGSLLADLERGGLPVAAPVGTLDGAARALVESDRPLSVALHPLIDGELLDAADLDAVHATGELVGRLHHALADLDPAPFRDGPRESGADLREQIRTAVDRMPPERAPRAHARLTDLLDVLPALDVAPQLGHGDIRGANVLVRDHRVAALLDFDELSIRHRVVEISLGAVLLATEFRRWPPAPLAAQRSLMRGYEGVVQLTDAERAWSEALRIAYGLSQIPTGPDPAGWADAVEASV
jgi:homoserine kinase type II